jgi:hypothetical protein
VVGLRLLALFCLSSLAFAQDSYALIAGSVFRPNGTAMPSVEVVLTPEPGEKPARKPKSQKQTSNFRGEFTFRVPAKAMRYTLSVRASGYKPLTKTVEVAGDERQDVSLMLESGQ